MDYPKFSIITCSLDGSGLADTVNSIVVSEFTNYEVIIVVKTRTHDVDNVLKELQGDSRFRMVSDDGSGIYSAMNLGSTVAIGDNLMFLNAGDKLKSMRSLSVLAHLAENAVWGYGDIEIVGAGKNSKRYSFRPYSKTLHRFGWKYVPHPATFVSREVFESFGKFDLEYGVAADQHLLLRVAREFPPSLSSTVISIFSLGGQSTRKVKESMDDFHQVSLQVFGPLLNSSVIDSFAWNVNGKIKTLLKNFAR